MLEASGVMGLSSPPQAVFSPSLPEVRYGKMFTVVYGVMGMGREGGKPFS